MNQYISLKGIYLNGNVRLMESPPQKIISNSEVLVLIPISDKNNLNIQSGISINNFFDKINLIQIGGDSVLESEEIYNV